jgi:hypothetical protein
MSTVPSAQPTAGHLARRSGPFIFAVTFAMQAAAIVLALNTRVGEQPFAVQPLLAALASSVLALAFSVVGAVLSTKLPRHRIGWLLSAAGFCIALNSLTWWYLTKAYETIPPSLPATGEFGMIGQLLGTPVALLCIGTALAVFPNGEFLSPRWRLLPIGGIVAVASFILGAGLGSPFVPYFPGVPNPFFVPEIPTPLVIGLRVLGALIGLFLVAGAAMSLVLRYRRVDDEQRHQLRWIAYAAVVTGLVSGMMILAFNTAGTAQLAPRTTFTTVFWLVFCLGSITIPVAFLVAITRYRLYAIDQIINGTIVYFGLVAILAGIYAGLNELLKRLMIALTGQQSEVALVVTTLVLATTLTPIRQFLERRAESRFKSPRKTLHGEASLSVEEIEAIARRAADLAIERIESEPSRSQGQPTSRLFD